MLGWVVTIENDQNWGNGDRKKREVKKLIGRFGGIGAGKKMDNFLIKERESWNECQDNCLGLSQTDGISVTVGNSTEEVVKDIFMFNDESTIE